MTMQGSNSKDCIRQYQFDVTLEANDAIFENMLAIFNLNREQFSSWPDEKSKDLIKAYMA